jgi:hypothetical protein
VTTPISSDYKSAVIFMVRFDFKRIHLPKNKTKSFSYESLVVRLHPSSHPSALYGANMILAKRSRTHVSSTVYTQAVAAL